MGRNAGRDELNMVQGKDRRGFLNDDQVSVVDWIKRSPEQPKPAAHVALRTDLSVAVNHVFRNR